MTVDRRNTILSIVLAIIIVVLAVILVRSIVIPYKSVEKREALTNQVRTRMLNLRNALMLYQRHYNHFPATKGGLDSLMTLFTPDSMQSIRDSIFVTKDYGIMQDSLIFSPRPPHKKFEYTMTDSLFREIYVLKDPDSGDQIGSLTNITLINTPNWN